MLPFREFPQIVFEGDDRLGIVAGIKISGANGVKNWLNLRRYFHSGDDRFEICRGLGVIAGLVVMAAGMPYLGFSVTSFITMIILLRAVDQSSWLTAVSLAFISTASVFWLFGQMLGMALPRGPWGW